VLEIGFGSGPNPPYYNGTAEEIIVVDSSPGMLALHRHGDLVAVQHDRCGMASRGGAQSSAAWRSPAVRRTRAVTGSQGGGLAASSDAAVAPLRRGCHLNRKVDDRIRAAEFDLTELATD
jgi:hypothetical protein